MFQNIPPELRQRPQWVVWRAELTDTGRPTKIPYNPMTGGMAMSNEPATWATFETAIAAFNTGQYTGVGYMLHDSDPFTFTDLDDPYAVEPDGRPKHANPAEIAKVQAAIYERFKGTYAEFSPSGKGLHIISLGISPAARKRNAVEMYSRLRFMTMTGNVFDNSPITDRQEAITWLYNEMGTGPAVSTYQGEFEDKEPDQTVVDRALNAANGQKFRDLAYGNWQQYYGSQSEADFAFIDILAYYTQSRFQIARLFRQSALGQRDKAKRETYVSGMIDRAFDRQPAPQDIEAMANAINAQFAAEIEKARSTIHSSEQRTGPGLAAPGVETLSGNPVLDEPEERDNPYLQSVPGLLGQIAYYIYNQAPRPVPEIALAGAIGLMAGICGRSYNVSGTGLNQYTLLLARTGRGKEAINSGIAKLMARVTDIDGGGCPGASEFVGPGDIASGQALAKHLGKKSKSFVSVLGEVDLTLKNMVARNANAGLVKLKQIMLRAYSASGRGETLGDTIYSDQDKNTGVIAAPAFSIVGEGTPGRFYAMLDEDLIADGLLPRFTIIEYNGDRVPLNMERQNVQPDPGLVKALASLCGYSLMLNNQNRVIDVQLTKEAYAFMHQFDLTVDGIMNKAGNDTLDQLWNRAYLKAMKLAALVAIGCDMVQPTITIEHAKYAVAIVKRDTARLVAKFVSGDVGDGMSKQMQDMKKIIRKGMEIPEHRWPDLGMTWEMARDRLVPYRFLQNSLANIASFKNDRSGTSRAIETVLRDMTTAGLIAVVGVNDLAKYGKQNGRYYIVTNAAWLAS